MQAWRVHELGEPEAVLRLDEIDPPAAGPNEVVVDVAASSLNFPDVLMCRGEYQVKPPLPFTPGAEVSGVVSAVGDGVDAGLLGQRVIAIRSSEAAGSRNGRSHRRPRCSRFPTHSAMLPRPHCT